MSVSPWPCPEVGCGEVLDSQQRLRIHLLAVHHELYDPASREPDTKTFHVEEGDIVRVEWFDSFTSHGWQHYHGHEMHPCTSAGIVIATDEDALVITSTVMKDDGGHTMNLGYLVIPWSAVREVKSL